MSKPNHDLNSLLRTLDRAMTTLGGKPLPPAHGCPNFSQKGLIQLFDSFPVASLQTHSPQVEEWNPISQRPVLPLTEPPRPEDMSFEFAKIDQAARRFLTLAHESMHVLLWEPFFCGKLNPSRTDFTELSLAFEGVCFWFSDIIVNRQLRVRAPDGELMFSRSSVSQVMFHPYRAFEALNIKDRREILNIYIRAFRGEPTPLLSSRRPTVSDLAVRVYQFYKHSRQFPMQMYDALDEAQIFTEFFSRFCQIDGLPSILPGAILKIDPRETPEKYAWSIFKGGLAAIDKMSRQELARVRTRRALQVRAYSICSLRSIALKRNWVHTGSKLDGRQHLTVLRAMDQYALGLESLLKKLVAHSGADHILAKDLPLLDRYYDTHIRRIFVECGTFPSRRIQIRPTMPPHSTLCIGEDRSRLRGKELVLYARNILRLHMNNEDLIGPDSSEPSAVAVVHRLLAKISICERHESLKTKKALSKAIDQFLRHPTFLAKWSVPLSTVSPRQNSFRELLMGYT